MSTFTFKPADESVFEEGDVYIKALIVDDSGQGAEIRIMSDGRVEPRPLTARVEVLRKSPLWEEVL